MSQTASQALITESRRLTLTSNSNTRQRPLTNNIPNFSFSLPPSSQIIKPLPKPPKLIKPTKTPEEKKKEKVLNNQKKIRTAKAKKLERERGPLPEVEEGEYDEFGFWTEYEKKIPVASLAIGEEQGEEIREELRLRGGAGNGGREEDSQVFERGNEEGGDTAIPDAVGDLEAIGQAIDDLLDPAEIVPMPPSKQPSQVPPASTAPRASQHKRKFQEEPMTLNDLNPGSSRLRQDTYIPSAMLNRHRISSIRGGIDEDDPVEDDDQDWPMPVSAQPRRPSLYQNEYDFDSQEEVRLSPTEVNSSAIREPVSRSQTRRSNDRSRVYSLQPPSLPIRGTPDPPKIPPSYAVSDTQPDPPDSPGFTSAPAPGPQRIKTYAKTSKSAPSRQQTIVKSRDPAERLEFKDQFSPEPEWEQEHLDDISRADRSKRAGSTSWWPEPNTPDSLYDQASDEEEDDDEEEDMEGRVRQILGEVELNEKGHRIVRGNKRNGPWPDERLKGLFDDDSQDFPRHPELYRPVSERFHLVKVKEEPRDLVEGTPPPPDEIRVTRKHNHRANHDRPIVHPPPQLIMRRERSVAERLHDYTHRINARQTQRKADLPNNPVVVTNIKSRIKPTTKRRSKFGIPNLPASVLKPITTVPIDEYRQQLKSRIPGDGFLNPVLIKAGRLGTRDAIIKQHQSRIKSTGKRGVKTQTPIVDPQGDPDPIEVSQTQTQVPRDEQPGFAVRQLERVKATTARYQKLRPKLPFTSQSPPPVSYHTDGDRENGRAMRFTAQSPPRPRRQYHEVDFDMEDEEDNRPTARPADDVPGLMAPKVGFGSRYKKKNVETHSDPSDTTTSASTGQGFIRRRPKYTRETSSATIRGEPIYEQNDTGIEEPEPRSTQEARGQHKGSSQYEQEPLFLSHHEFDKDMDVIEDEDQDRDIEVESNRSTHDTVPEPRTEINTGLSGAQLCNNLLKSAANLPLPLIRSTKSKREEKREEMARRIIERDHLSRTTRPEGKRLSEKVHEHGPLFDELENDDEEVGHQPTLSQLERRRVFLSSGKSTGTEQATMGEAEPGVVQDTGPTHLELQIQSTTQCSSFKPDSNVPPARNPGRYDPSPDTPAISTGTATATASRAGTAKLKRTGTTSRFFQPPRVVQKVANNGVKGTAP